MVALIDISPKKDTSSPLYKHYGEDYLKYKTSYSYESLYESYSKKDLSHFCYEIGGYQFDIPIELKEIESILKKYESILTLEANWDEHGSEGFLNSTWYAVATFLINYSKNIYEEYGCIVDIPKIYPSAKGSIDLDWETESYGILINITKNGTKATFFADDKKEQVIEGSFNPFNFNINLLPKAIS